ncbi:MAG: TadE/TadG family type IV pilus assembly protein [Blastocatellales bacterium]
MMRIRVSRQGERGATLVELGIGAAIFFTALFGVLEFSRLMWTHNALADATRIGARFASVNAQNTTNVKNMVVYGKTNPLTGDKPVVYGLTTGNVDVVYSTGTVREKFGVKNGTVRVRITGYQFNFNVPLFGGSVTLPNYQSVATGESAGCVPPVGCP